jgi:hypothetical protein
MYRCEDLEKYVKETGAHKANVLVRFPSLPAMQYCNNLSRCSTNQIFYHLPFGNRFVYIVVLLQPETCFRKLWRDKLTEMGIQFYFFSATAEEDQVAWNSHGEESDGGDDDGDDGDGDDDDDDDDDDVDDAAGGSSAVAVGSSTLLPPNPSAEEEEEEEEEVCDSSSGWEDDDELGPLPVRAPSRAPLAQTLSHLYIHLHHSSQIFSHLYIHFCTMHLCARPYCNTRAFNACQGPQPRVD